MQFSIFEILYRLHLYHLFRFHHFLLFLIIDRIFSHLFFCILQDPLDHYFEEIICLKDFLWNLAISSQFQAYFFDLLHLLLLIHLGLINLFSFNICKEFCEGNPKKQFCYLHIVFESNSNLNFSLNFYEVECLELVFLPTKHLFYRYQRKWMQLAKKLSCFDLSQNCLADWNLY
jgi:hypothetical protein